MSRRAGIVGFLFSVGVACTQLFGGEQNTLAPAAIGQTPTMANPLQPGSGLTELCAKGQMHCEGPLLQTCADDRTSWVTVQRCAAAALCQEEPAACLTATCNADEMTCAGSLLQKCNADRTGWDLFATCVSPAHCNADLRQCMPEACNAGDRRCDRSEVDQSPVLEVCRDDRTDWALLDACVTRQLCDQTLTAALAGGLVVGSDGMVQLQAPSTPSTVVQCNRPACAVGEVRCAGSQLEVCEDGRTGWSVAEECASPELCAGSLINLGPAGTPQCLAPACAPNQHQCAEGGVLQVCSEDRTGFRTIQTCIGPPFCNAALADQGGEGCQDAPCIAGEMQCNGAQIQVCRQDRTALDDTGPRCETADLCNRDDPSNAFCEEPACRRGATSGSEFFCDGAELQRCNEGFTGYDTLQTCVTAALCDASQRFDGCRPPVCLPGEHACTDNGFLQTCNAGQTAFENTENCGSRGQCDANAGRCADPCEPGAVRCNSQSGDLEECRDLLTGWRTIADCVSLPLCDAANRRCNPPVCTAGTRRCETRGQNPVITQCAPGRERFVVTRTCATGQLCDAQNNECDVCTPNSTSCDGDTLVRCDARGQAQNRQTPACGAGLCSAAKGRCLVCNPINSARCSGLQLRVCAEGEGGNEFERSENCDTPELCGQTLNDCGRGLNGQSCQCNDGVCAPNQLRCQNGTTIQRCNAGLTGFDTIQTCQFGCNAGSTTCNECAGTTGQCNGTQFRACNNGRLAAAINCADNNPCTNVACNAQNGCSFPPVNNGTQCADNDLCDGTETCNNGTCSAAGTRVTCQEDTNPCTTVSCNTGTGACAPNNVANGTLCTGGMCQGGQCIQNRVCAANETRCVNNGFPEICNANGTGFVPDQLCSGTSRVFCNGTTRVVQPCGLREQCTVTGTFGSCTCTGTTTRCLNGQPQTCSNGAFVNLAFCSAATQNVCNGNNLVPTPCPAPGNPCFGASCDGLGSGCIAVPRTGQACVVPAVGNEGRTCSAQGQCCLGANCRDLCTTDNDCAANARPCTQGACTLN